MHSKDARAKGETEQRLYGLNAWRETPYYSARERAALEWTEALTLVAEGHVPDEVYERVWKQFSEEELVHLSLAIASINGFNRLSIAFRTVPGDYVPGSLTTLRGVSVSPISNPCLPANSHFTRQTTVKHTFASLSNPVFDARQTPEAGGPSTTSSPRLSKSGTAWSLQMTL